MFLKTNILRLKIAFRCFLIFALFAFSPDISRDGDSAVLAENRVEESENLLALDGKRKQRRQQKNRRKPSPVARHRLKYQKKNVRRVIKRTNKKNHYHKRNTYKRQKSQRKHGARNNGFKRKQTRFNKKRMKGIRRVRGLSNKNE